VHKVRKVKPVLKVLRASRVHKAKPAQLVRKVLRANKALKV